MAEANHRQRSSSELPSAALDVTTAADQPPRWTFQNPQVGDVLGKYRISGRLGRGGMGVVYEAHDTLLERAVAIKLLPEPVATAPQLLQRFLREAQVAARLDHPNVVTIHEIDQVDGTYFIVMELIRGGSVQDRLRNQTPIPWPEATRIIADACRGLMAAHAAGLIHRDIKPANILLSISGLAKLADFGLAKITDQSNASITESSSVAGTPHFMSPEQCRSERLDERSDIYSLGATYYALLIGRPPFQGDGPFQIMFAHCAKPVPDPRLGDPAIPEPCAAIVRRALAKYPAERYATTRDLLADLEAVLATAPAGTFTVPLAEPVGEATARVPESGSTTAIAPAPKRRRPGRRLALAAGLAAAVLIALGVGYQAWTRHQAPGPLPSASAWEQHQAAVRQAIQSKRLDTMRAVGADLASFRKALATTNDPQLQEIAPRAQALAERLDLAIAFRARIKDTGYVLANMRGRADVVRISPDGRWLAVGNAGGNGGVRVYDWATGEQRFLLWPREDKTPVEVSSVAFAPNGDLAAACLGNRGIKVWNVETGRERTPRLGGIKGTFRSLAYSPDGTILAAGMDSATPDAALGFLHVWDMRTERKLHALPAHTDHIWALQFAPGDGRLLAGAGNDSVVHFWDPVAGQWKKDLVTNYVALLGLTFSPDGKVLVASGYNQKGRMLQFWDPAAEQLKHSVEVSGTIVRAVAFSADGTLLAIGNDDKVIRVWDAAARRVLHTYAGHTAGIASVAFSPEGEVLATGGADGTVRLWDVSRLRGAAPVSAK